LAQRFRVVVMERRGRGASGDAAAYTIEQEFADVATLIDALGGPVDVVGHSFGALCALEAALLTPNIRRLVLYEPPLPQAFPYWPAALGDHMLPLLDAGESEAALRAFLAILLGLSNAEIAVAQTLPTWPRRVGLVATIPRELQALDHYAFTLPRLRSIQCPTLFLLGGTSPAQQRTIADTLHAAIPTSHIVVLPGQGHGAMRTAPDLFVQEVVQFLTAAAVR
jgi:pimeloyl-ACP methyl ester carboxylesterase